MYHIGIDPGSEGAVVVLKHKEAIAAAHWKPCMRKKRKVRKLTIVIKGGDPTEVILERLSDVGYQILRVLALLGIRESSFACEDFYMGRNARTTIELAKGAGALISPLEYRLGKAVTWVAAADWRQVVLGLKRNAKRDEVKNASILLIPKRISGLSELAKKLGTPDHITDAAGIAEWSRIKTEEEDDKRRNGESI